MDTHDLPTCPTLRVIATALNDFWSQFPDDHPYVEHVLDVARQVSDADAAGVLHEAIDLAQTETDLDRREAAAMLALSLMRVHPIGVRSTTTGEALGICEECGGVVLLNSRFH
jgi:hypothetical protein